MRTRWLLRGLGLVWMGIVAACGLVQPAPFLQTVTSISTSAPTILPAPAQRTPILTDTPGETAPTTRPVTPSATSTWTPAWTPTVTSSPTWTPTPDPYAGLTIDDLVDRTYGGGTVHIGKQLADNSYFTRYLITYPSDGLTIYGFMDLPKLRGPAIDANASISVKPLFPVIIAIHGYIDPEVYQTLDYTTGYADALARAGYLVLHPNLRDYPPSDDGPNLFRVGMAVDVLNLIALVKDQGGRPGPLEQADASRIGVWGHSMGGGISIRVITVNQDVRAALLYGAMSADDRLNYERIFTFFSGGTRGVEEQSVPPGAYARISPIGFLDRIRAAVSIHHGEQDSLVPPAWSADLCRRLEDLHVTVECFSYPGQPHTFQGENNDLLIQRMVAFYDRYLAVP